MKKLLNNKIIVLFILSSLGTACRKDKPIPEPPIDVIDTTTTNCDTCITCDEFPPMPELGYGYVQTGTQYLTPCFNPNNENEFVYLRSGTASVAELVKYDLITKTEIVLCNTVHIATAPQWGKLDYITFSTTGWEVWKIKSDGTDLTQLTFGVNNQFPYFSHDGNSIYYNRSKQYSNYELDQNPNLYYEYIIMKIDLDGNEIDSITAPNVIPNNYYQKWNKAVFVDNLVYFFGGTESYVGIYVLNLTNNIISPINTWTYTGTTNPLSVQYLNNKIYYCFWHSHLMTVDVNSGIESIYVEGCDTKSYANITISSDGNKMLVEKVINTPTIYEFGAVDIDEQHEIWLIDLVDKTETQILGD